MAKHALKNKLPLKKLTAVGAALAMTLGALVSAQASGTTYDASGVNLNFDKVSPLPASKAVVEAAAFANITLSGAQTIDLVDLVVGDLVLAYAQTEPKENGVYVVAAGAWSRASFYDAAGEVNKGDLIFVKSGIGYTGNNAGAAFMQYEAAPTPGTNNIRFNKAVEIKEVRAATTTNIALANLQTVDGISLSATNRVLVKNQTNPAQNGIYLVVDNGSWTRFDEYDQGSEIIPGTFVFAEEGTTNGGSGWFQQNAVTTVGTDPIAFAAGLVQAAGFGDPDIGENLAVNNTVDYLDIAVIDGVGIDARITFTAQYGTESSDGAADLLDKLDDATGSGQNRYLEVSADWDVTALSQDRFVEFEIEFFKDIESTPVAVTLENVYLSFYDIDNAQFLSISGFDRYYLSDADTILTPTVQGNLLRLQSANTNTSGSDSLTKGRASFEFDSVSTFTYRLGGNVNLAPSESGSSFSLDFGPGEPFTGGARGQAVLNPVTNPPVQEAVQPAPAPYSGPLLVRLDISCLAAGAAGTANLIGERLSTITGATVDGKAITLSAISATSVTLAFPALAVGNYDVIYSSTNGSITHIKSLTVCAASSPAPVETVVSEAETKPFSIAKRFSNYRGDRGPVVVADRAAITAFIKANPGLTHVTCVGSTSGRPAAATDQALAMARAKNACSVVEGLVPGVKTRLVTSTGRGVGQFFRAVTLFGKGEKAN